MCSNCAAKHHGVCINEFTNCSNVCSFSKVVLTSKVDLLRLPPINTHTQRDLDFCFGPMHHCCSSTIVCWMKLNRQYSLSMPSNDCFLSIWVAFTNQTRNSLSGYDVDKLCVFVLADGRRMNVYIAVELWQLKV